MKRPLPFQFFLAASAAVLLTFPSGCSDDPQFFFGPTRDGGELMDAGSEVGPRLDGGRDVDSDSGVDGGPAGDSGESDSATADIGPEDGGIEDDGPKDSGSEDAGPACTSVCFEWLPTEPVEPMEPPA